MNQTQQQLMEAIKTERDRDAEFRRKPVTYRTWAEQRALVKLSSALEKILWEQDKEYDPAKWELNEIAETF